MISVNVISPGLIETPMSAELTDHVKIQVSHIELASIIFKANFKPSSYGSNNMDSSGSNYIG